MYATREPLIGRTDTLQDLLYGLSRERLSPAALFALPALLPVGALLMVSWWWKSGVIVALAGAFGMWALCERVLDDAAVRVPPLPGWQSRALRAMRGGFAALGILLFAALFLLIVARMMGVGASCLGCAG